MRIIKFQAENVKKLSVVEITPKGAVVQITGANDSGKSSVLDAIFWALGGQKHIEERPIRDGETSAMVRLELGEETVEVIVTRTFSEGGTTKLKVESIDGAVFPSPQGVLDKLIGSLAFDPLEFSRMSAKERLEQLRKLVTFDVDLDGLDRANAIDYDARTELTRQIKTLDGQIAGVIVSPSLPVVAIDTADLLDQIEKAADHNAAIQRGHDRITRERGAAGDAFHAAHDKRERAAQLIAEAEKLEAAAREKNEWAQREVDTLAAAQLVDVTDIRRQIDEAGAINKNAQAAQQRDRLKEQRKELADEADFLTAAIESRTRSKAAAIAAAKMPIDGIGFGVEGVLFNGVPFEQASSAQQLRVSASIGMAMNPTLRVLLIKDAPLLDEKNLDLLAQMADTREYQVWLERVDTSGNVGFVMENGAVKTVAG